MSILRERGVVWYFLIEAKTCKPAPGKMHPQFLDEFAFTADAVQITDQQNPHQELRVDGWTPSFAIAVPKALAHEIEVDVLTH